MPGTRLFACVSLCVCVSNPAAYGQTPSPGWKAGYAEAEITPKPGEPVMPAGFGRPRIIEGAELPLRAQALALEDAAGKRAILFTADVLGFGRITVDAVRHKLRKSHGIPPEAVCFAASHTHWGPAVNYRTGATIGEVNVWYLGFLETTLLELADEALENLAPADVAYGSCDVQIGMCRRLPDDEGIRWAPNPDGSYDRHTPILHIRMLGAGLRMLGAGLPTPPTRAGLPTPPTTLTDGLRERAGDLRSDNVARSGDRATSRATAADRATTRISPKQVVLVGHACHPTSRGLVEDKWSPDYPGAMRRKLETELDDCRAMFVMGCGGDAKVVDRDPGSGEPNPQFAASPEQSYRAGFMLAQSVLECLNDESQMHLLRGELDFTLVRGTLRLQEGPDREEIEKLALEGKLGTVATWWARKNLAFPDHRRAFEYAVQSWRLGDLTMTALEGEVCADWGPLARSLAATEHAMTIGYANEVSCYIPTARIIREGGYEGDTSHRAYLLPAPFDPAMEVELTALIRRAIAELSGNEIVGSPAPPADARSDTHQLLVSRDESSAEQRIASPEQWEHRRRQIVARIEQVTGPVPGRAFRVPLDLEVLEEADCGRYVRKLIAYNVDPHDRVQSYLLIPHELRGKAPAIVALHGTNRYGKDPVVALVEKFPEADRAKMLRRAYGHELAERGYIVIAPDYWNYGHYRDTKYDPYQRGYASATMKGVWNHMRAVDVLETLEEVDADRIGAIGHSLGGYNTLFLGVFEPRVKVMVTSAGYNSFFDYAASEYGGGDLKNWGIDKHMRRIRTVYSNDPAAVPFDFPELLAALAPRPVFTNAPTRDEIFVLPGVTKCLDAARPVYELFNAGDRLEAQFPDAVHDFPDAHRAAAYDFLDRHLRD